MHPSLFTFLYDNDYTSPSQVTNLTPFVTDIMIRCIIHGGVESIDIPLGKNYVDAYLFQEEHLGKRVIIVDTYGDVVAEGTLMSVAVTESGARLQCKGPYFDLCYRQHYLDTASWVSTGNNDDVIKDILSTECPAVSGDQSNIDAAGTGISPWQSDEYAYPGDLIPLFAAMSDSQNREWYFWLKSAALAGVQPQKPIPYFKAQVTNRIDFVTYLSHMAPAGVELSPSLVDLANSVKIRYQGADGIQRITTAATDADSQAKYWLREVWNVNIGTVPLAAANRYRTMYKDKFKDPQQGASFRLNGFIYDRRGNRQPLWRVIKEFPCVVRVADLVPQQSEQTAVLDRRRTFYTLAADYSYRNNTLTITPDTESKRLELFLRKYRGPG